MLNKYLLSDRDLISEHLEAEDARKENSKYEGPDLGTCLTHQGPEISPSWLRPDVGS